MADPKQNIESRIKTLELALTTEQQKQLVRERFAGADGDWQRFSTDPGIVALGAAILAQLKFANDLGDWTRRVEEGSNTFVDDFPISEKIWAKSEIRAFPALASEFGIR